MFDNFDGTFVEVSSKSTGKKQTVPAEWLDHPVLGKNFELTPSQKAVDRLAGAPSEDWHVPELTQYAADQGIDLAGATRKDDVLAAITTHLSNNEPPSGGGEE